MIKLKRKKIDEGRNKKDRGPDKIDTIFKKKKQKGLPFIFVSILVPSFLISCK